MLFTERPPRYMRRAWRSRVEENEQHVVIGFREPAID